MAMSSQRNCSLIDKRQIDQIFCFDSFPRTFPHPSAASANRHRMHIELTKNQAGGYRHRDVVACVGWNSSGELYCFSDDTLASRWSSTGQHLGPLAHSFSKDPTSTSSPSKTKATDTPVYVLDMNWCPTTASKSAASSSEVYALAASDGMIQASI
jgi:hypothetical protein